VILVVFVLLTKIQWLYYTSNRNNEYNEKMYDYMYKKKTKRKLKKREFIQNIYHAE